MQEAQVVGDFFLPADQQSPGTVEPRMSTFHFPTPRFAATMLRLRDLVGLAWNMRCVAPRAYFTVDRFAGVALVEAKILGLGRRWLGALDGNGVERVGDQLLVRHIGAFHGHSQRHATAIDQRRAFDAELAAIGRVFPGFFPHPAVISSSLHLDFATSN